MAKQLARIFGTEEDKINCPFYFKIGACRHGERCSRTHCKPAFSPTILIKHIYPHPVRAAEMAALLDAGSGGGTELINYSNTKVQVDKEKAQEDFLQFFENFYMELGKFGRIESLHVSDNLCDHMLGHVYCKFFDEEDASDALTAMNGRYYNGQKMQVEFSPVFDFRDARCRGMIFEPMFSLLLLNADNPMSCNKKTLMNRNALEVIFKTFNIFIHYSFPICRSFPTLTSPNTINSRWILQLFTRQTCALLFIA